jgi:hypothetical protein
MIPRRLSPLLVLLAGCEPGVIELKDPPGGSETGAPTSDCPVFSVEPSTLTWSGVSVGSATTQSLLVTNPCSGAVDLAATMEIEGDTAFSLDVTAVAVSPGDAAVVNVTFTAPDDAGHAAAIRIATNDPLAPEAIVTLTGTAGDDADGDGWPVGDDCDDGDATINPGATEVWYDGVDQDCSGGSDYDRDGDGADSDNFGGADCNDYDAGVGPGVPESQDVADNDCDGLVDEDFIDEGDVVVDEIMHHPLAVGDTAGEWFELHNASDMAIDLVGWRFSSDGSEGFTVESTVVVDAGGWVVFGVNGDNSSNGGAYVEYAYDRDLLPLASDGNLIVWLEDTAIFDVEWQTTWAEDDGASLSLDPDHASIPDARLATWWCAGRTEMLAGDLGTPSRQNDQCTDVDEDGDGWSEDDGDCDDGDASIHPEADEAWDGVDTDCDGVLDNVDVDEAATGWLEGGAQRTYLGATSGAGLGDADGDGLADLVVGASAADNYAGSAWLIEAAVVSTTAGEPDDYDQAHFDGEAYGYAGSVAPLVRDVTGDGVGDVVIGGSAYGYSSYYGGPAIAVYAGGSLSGGYDEDDATLAVDDDSYGYNAQQMLAHLDMDGDGTAEVVYGNGYTGSGYAGNVWVVEAVSRSGSMDLDDADLTLAGDGTQDYLGSGVSGGDLNGDGYDDLLAGGVGVDDGGTDAGAWYLVAGAGSWAGSKDVDKAADAVIVGDNNSELVGMGDSAATGDYDGDGKLDLVVGGAGEDRIYLFLDAGSLSDEVSVNDADNAVEGEASTMFGWAISSGDLDGDGADDVAVGAPATNVYSVASFYSWWYYGAKKDGAVYAFHGDTLSTATAETDADVAIAAEHSKDLFGSVLSGIDDVDGDGNGDVAIAAPGADNNAGIVYVLLGQ